MSEITFGRYKTSIFMIPGLDELNDEFVAVLRDPMRDSVARTDAHVPVLEDVLKRYLSHDQIPLRSDTPAARGAWTALEAAADRAFGYFEALSGDYLPPESERLAQTRDGKGH
ncbi:hypothetical protein NQ166_12335 [Microbacterium sp. zg.Y1090]|uniref:hypothetical protein n=1 Tax=Microbacterium TaxID=33882 RepID=UPI00214B61AD|nr:MULTISPECIES: hypothetical protein [unclassified Microbacterium]MCR2813878.1 hypothetical protein [Microbacterium sp. zg.Y1084]MCR2819612.1 hypothetical protein [Microbacterium sp. zg.Y1090]MDL5487451.1 hypothetical protein [Microbacterium sp. zg-Y1211]WIM28142.1 hypothetical protein QNO26_13495 [Microbacterium sp. zg-Y1090]